MFKFPQMDIFRFGPTQADDSGLPRSDLKPLSPVVLLEAVVDQPA
jgi:hypothetical protein